MRVTTDDIIRMITYKWKPQTSRVRVFGVSKSGYIVALLLELLKHAEIVDHASAANILVDLVDKPENRVRYSEENQKVVFWSPYVEDVQPPWEFL